MFRLASNVGDQVVYFYAGQVGLTGFTVYRARNGLGSVAMTDPTVTEVDSTNMPGVYNLLLDEDVAVATNNITEHMVFLITADGMAPQFVEIELFDTTQYTVDVNSMNGATVLGTGVPSDRWRGQ